jgi:uncharacterized membrane protein YkoI
MTKKIKRGLAAVAALAALALGGAAIAGAAGGSQQASAGGSQQASEPTPEQSAEPAASQEANEGPDRSIGGSALDQASASALKYTGGGQVTDTEVGDEESYYEVEVTRDDGSQVDVQLDRNFAVVGASADSEGG